MLATLPDNSLRKLSTWAVVLGSILVASWCRFIDPIINPDGVKYVLAAESFLRGEFAEGLQAYKWPMYSLVLASISKITSLSTEHAAVFFNTVMRILAGLAFLRLVDKFGANGKQLVLAAVVFVFYPGLNEVQSMIIRDIAYIACFMWMAVFFLQQINNPTSQNLTGFLATGIVATLFRIEGLVFLIGLSLFYLSAGTLSRRLKIAGWTALLVMLPVLVFGLLNWIYDGEAGNAWTVITTMLENTGHDYDVYVASLDSEWARVLLDKLSWPILGIAPIARLIFNLLEIATLGYVLVLAAGFLFRPLVSSDQPRISLMLKGWRWIVAINVLVLVGFVLIRQIVTDRYPLSLAMMLIVFVPFAITRLREQAEARSLTSARVATSVIALVLVINSVEGMDRFTNKRHLRDAGTWIQSQVGEYNPRRIYINDRVVDYYAGKDVAEKDVFYSLHNVNAFALTYRWAKLDFMAITLHPRGKPGFYRNFRYRIGKEPDRIFENEKGSKVLVYDFRNPPTNHGNSLTAVPQPGHQ